MRRSIAKGPGRFLAAWAAAGVLAGPPSIGRAQEAWVGVWSGEMEREGKTADLTFEIEKVREGYAGNFTSLRQRVMEYPLDAVEIEGDRIRLVLGGEVL